MPTPKNVNPWPKAEVPFVIQHQDLSYMVAIGQAMLRWYWGTGVKFCPRTDEDTYVVFAASRQDGSNTDHIGYVKGQVTTVHLGQSWLATHEIGHVLGLIHEQNRSDRDQYVKVLWGNVKGGRANGNFQRIADSDNQGLPYDPESIMQYGADWQSSNGKSTEQWIGDPTQGIHLHNGWTHLTANDIQAVRLLYAQELNGRLVREPKGKE